IIIDHIEDIDDTKGLTFGVIPSKEDILIKCSFCSKDFSKEKIFSSDNANICFNCLEVCFGLTEEVTGAAKSKINSSIDFSLDGDDISKDSKINLLSPKEIFEELSKYVIGQEEAKKVIS